MTYQERRIEAKESSYACFGESYADIYRDIGHRFYRLYLKKIKPPCVINVPLSMVSNMLCNHGPFVSLQTLASILVLSKRASQRRYVHDRTISAISHDSDYDWNFRNNRDSSMKTVAMISMRKIFIFEIPKTRREPDGFPVQNGRYEVFHRLSEMIYNVESLMFRGAEKTLDKLAEAVLKKHQWYRDAEAFHHEMGHFSQLVYSRRFK